VRKYTTGTAGFGINYLLRTIMPKCISAPLTPTCGLRRRGLFACWSLDVAEG